MTATSEPTTAAVSDTPTPRVVILDAAATEPSRYQAERDAGCVNTVDGYILRIHSRLQGRVTSFAAYFRTAKIGTRQQMGGPVLLEDYAYLVALPTVIAAAHYGDAYRPHAQVEAADGDWLVFAGHVWEIDGSDRWCDPKLRLVR